MGGSLIGAKREVALKWAERYIKTRQLSVAPEELLRLAERQEGTRPGITKTKLRKAAALLLAGQAGLERQAS